MADYSARLSKEQLSEVMSRVPPPDCYIIMGKGPQLSEEQIAEKYNMTKAEANRLSRVSTSSVVDTNSPKFKAFKDQYITNTMADITNKMKTGELASSSKMAFVMGLAGAGKTTTINALKKQLRAYHANMDAVKEDVAKFYNIDINHPDIHPAGGNIFRDLVKKLQEKKVNFIQEKVGDEIGWMETLITDARNSGYSVTMDLVHVSNNTSRQRNISRCQGFIEKGEAPRMLPDDVIVNCGNGPMETYLALTQEHPEWFDECRCFTTERELDENGKPKPPVEIRGLGIKKGQRIASAEYFAEGRRIESMARNHIAQQVLSTLKIKKDECFKPVMNWNKNFNDANKPPYKPASQREENIINLIQTLSSKLLEDVFQVYGNECINDRKMVGEFNFDTAKLESKLTTVVVQKYDSATILKELTAMDKKLEEENARNRQGAVQQKARANQNKREIENVGLAQGA
ncbi:MAG: zeta toxin family protein [Clostridia bacterium]|nr:zeta toxin family protein [Clostridia bacterium]